MVNYSFSTGKKLPDIGDNHVFKNCNFMQKNPNTEIFKDKSGLVFNSCNLINCKLPSDTKIISCNTVQKSLCSHIYPKLDLPECSVNCEHVIDTDTIKVDNIIIDTIYYYKDLVIK